MNVLDIIRLVGIIVISLHRTYQICQDTRIQNGGLSSRLTNCSHLMDTEDIKSGFSDIPGFRTSGQLFNLTLFDCQFKILPKNFLERGFHNIYNLRIENSQVETVYSGVFENIPNIHEITISHSKLLTVGNNIFSSLKKLRILNLSHNSIETISEQALLYTSALEVLSLSHNQIGDIPSSTFNSLQSLLILNLSYNSLDALDDKIFESCVNLKLLDLNHNNLSDLTEIIFKSLKSLTFLDISNNPLKHVDVTITSSALHLETLLINDLHFTRENMTQIRNNLEIKTLKLSDNFISQVDEDLVSHLKNMNTLDLSNNMIGKIDKLSFLGLHEIEYLDLSNNKLESLPELTLASQSQKLRYLDVSGNPFIIVEIPLINKLLNLETIKLNALSLDETKCEVIKTLPKNVQELYLSKNKFIRIDSRIFNNLTSLIHLDLSYNRLKSLDKDAFAMLMNLKTLHIQGNRIEDLSSSVFRNFHFMNYLDLSDNRFNTFPTGLFDRCQELVFLNVSFNHLQRLTALNLHPLKKLQKLYLNDNDLFSIQGLDFIPQLKLITLENNAWNCEDLFELLELLDEKNIKVKASLFPLSTHHLRGIQCQHNIRIDQFDNFQNDISDPDMQKLRNYMNDAFRDVDSNLRELSENLEQSEHLMYPGSYEISKNAEADSNEIHYVYQYSSSGHLNSFMYGIIVIGLLILCSSCVSLYLKLTRTKFNSQNIIEMA